MVATVALMAALIAGVMLAGAPRPPASALWALVMGLALGWVWLRGSRPATPWAMPALVLGGLSLVQLVPLPHALRAVLSSESTHLVDLVLGDAGHGWRPLAVDPSLTWQATARVFGAAAASLLAVEVARRSDGRRWLRAGLLGLVMVVVALGILTAAGWRMRWLATLSTSSRLSAPLRNANHLGALLAAILPLVWSVGARAMEARSERRIAILLLGLGGNVALFATASRGAVLVGVLVQVVVLGSLWRQGGRARVAAKAVVAALLLGMVVGGAGLWSRLRPTDAVDDVGIAATRATVWASAIPLMRAHPWVGIGRGALPEVLPRYTPIAAHHRYDFIENELWQLGIDLGALGLVVVAAAAWCAWRMIRQRRKSSLGQAALWGLLAFVLSNLFDFSWELPLLATVAAILAALGVEAEADPPVQPRRLLPLLASLAAVFTASMALGPLGRSTERDPSPPCAPMFLARHPLDGEVPLRCLGSGLSRDPSRDLDRTLMLLPYDGRAHGLAARLLYAAGQRDQAALEARLSLEQTQWLLLDGQVEEVLALFGDDDVRAAAAIPDRPLSVLRNAVARLVAGARPALAATLAARLQLLEPSHVGAAQILLRVAGQRRDTNAAVAAARALLAADDSEQSTERIAALLPQLGARDEAFALFMEPPSNPASVTARARAAVAVAVADPPAPALWPGAQVAAEAALARAVSLDDKAQLHEALASLFARQQDAARAAAERLAAARLRGH